METETDYERLTPGYHGEECLYNGEHEGFELCCDECDFFSGLFPGVVTAPEFE